MSTAQGTASPRAPRGKHQHGQAATAQPSAQSNNGRQGQPRRPRGNRAHNSNNQNASGGVSPNRPPINANPVLAESAVFSSEEAQLPTGPRNPKKHTQSQPSIDRVFSPQSAQNSLTDNESRSNNPSATPAKIQGAYAGPTFHASPAPSALPIPKFLSRSVPAKTRAGPPTPPPDESSDSANSPSPTQASPSRAPIAVPRRNDDSPLDLLFKADRAERAKTGSGSPASSGFFAPPQSSRPPNHKHDSFNSLNAPFPIELDSHTGPAHLSPPPVASPGNSRSVTDPNRVPQLKDVSASPSNNNDVMQDLLSRLSQSQKRPVSGTPPGPDGFAPSDPQTRHETPSPSFEGRSTVRSASGPSTPAAASQEAADFFYGNRNLSPLFKAAKGDTSKRNSGLRTEITADSPLVAQGAFQDFPSVSSPPAIDPNTFSRQAPGNGSQIPSGPRRGSVPYVQPYRETPNNRRKTPAKQAHQPRPDSYPNRAYANGSSTKSGRAGVNGAPASVKKPATSMMSFVPSSVAAKKHSSSTPPSAPTPPPTRASPAPNTLSLEQDLKRLLNLKMAEEAPGVR